MNNYHREQNDTVSVGKPWGKGRLAHDFSGPLASRNPNTGNNNKPIGFQNRFDAFDKRKNNRGFEHENNFQDVNQQNSSTRFFLKTLFASCDFLHLFDSVSSCLKRVSFCACEWSFLTHL
jgi:hypothetical protein